MELAGVLGLCILSLTIYSEDKTTHTFSVLYNGVMESVF